MLVSVLNVLLVSIVAQLDLLAQPVNAHLVIIVPQAHETATVIQVVYQPMYVQLVRIVQLGLLFLSHVYLGPSITSLAKKRLRNVQIVYQAITVVLIT